MSQALSPREELELWRRRQLGTIADALIQEGPKWYALTAEQAKTDEAAFVGLIQSEKCSRGQHEGSEEVIPSIEATIRDGFHVMDTLVDGLYVRLVSTATGKAVRLRVCRACHSVYVEQP